MISYLTSKQFPKRLSLTQDELNEIIMGPVNAVEKSAFLKDDQDMLDITVEFSPATLTVELSRTLSKIEDIFQTLVKEDMEYVEKVKAATSRIGSIHTASAEEELATNAPVKSLQELAREALENAGK